MDINEMIRAQMKSGMSTEAIANAFADALNKIQEETDKQNKENAARAEILDRFQRIFNNAVTQNQFDVTSASALFALTLGKSHPEWTADDIKSCFEVAIHTAEVAEQTIHKTPDELANLVINKGMEFLDKLLSEDTDEEDSDSDEAVLAEFLKMFH